MPLCDPARSTLLLIDLQARLMPAVAGADEVVAQARRLLAAAEALDVPVVRTEQNPAKLGATLPELAGTRPHPTLAKLSFDVWRSPDIRAAVPGGREVVVAGCEAHVCVLQTALALLSAGRAVKVVRDAVGSRRAESREAALARMERHGADIVTTEMVVFEWLGGADHPRFRELVALIK